jgi:2',3'-cyclic-nucleotide 2'-phosphodiesterase (5'-nucleotidase family)
MPTRLRIVAVNDVYMLDNLPRLATLVRESRAGVDLVLVTLAGDFLAPSVLSSLDNGRGMVACLNAIGVTHVTFGNHEDDIPHAELIARMGELDATWLASNVHGLPRPAPDHDIVGVGAAGVRVGLFGVVLTDPLIFRRPPFGGVLGDPTAAALRETAVLTGPERCAWVVAMTHQSADDDRALARALAGIPAIIIGGHEHTALDETIAGIRILKAGADATHALVIDAEWDAAASGPPRVAVRLEPVAGYAEDPAVRALVDRHLAPVRSLSTATLLELAPGEQLSSVGVRARQTSVGTLVCSRLREVLGAEACVFNAGGIRGARDYRDRFTFGDLEAEVPFDNELVVIEVPGNVLEDAITSSRADAPHERGGFLQVDNRIHCDPVTNRLAAVADAPFDAARRYRVALVRELCFGLDHVTPLIAYATAHPGAVPLPGGARTPKELLVRSFAMSLWNQLGGFEALDTNHDGRVDTAEVASALSRERHGQPVVRVAELVVHALDSDHDEAVSPDEAVAATPQDPRST